MNTNEKSLKGFRVVAILMIFLQLCNMIAYLSPAILMGDIIESLNIDYTVAGFTITIVVAMCGVCMFIGSFVQDHIGTWNTIFISLILIAAGNLLTATSTTILVLMVGRAVLGIGYGFSQTSAIPNITYWFKGKAQTYMITINLIVTSIGLSLAYLLPGWIKTAFGSWESVYYVIAVFAAIVTVLWFIAGKLLHAPGFPERKMAEPGKQKAHGQSSLFKAIRVKQYWAITIICVFMMFINVVNGTYMPTILTIERGFLPEMAVTVTSIVCFVGMFGSMLGGFIATQTGRRKPIMIASISIMWVSLFGMLIANNTVLLIVAASIFGMSAMMFYPPLTSMVIETQPDYSILGGAFALTNGVGMIISLFIPSIFTKLSVVTGSMTSAFKILSVILFIALSIAFALKETGQKVKAETEISEIS
ncbi:Cyanate permease [Dethiosulfatibacter aminovorans DSM 17477]|uniref:Cyanate permease n=1 Tax=Dethiosulfatibacter aminovorans DSM 17477 TaxID=1121476 RepID=A0A1M6EMZ6_9FIRM|nr:MFS transporter [Dethiosulfatibacter aminovorans]SHI86729.1 Cyanate permease [Dethiosulfatibacter aminovorans DSM 17477]